MMTLTRLYERASRIFAAPTPEAGPVDGQIPPEIRYGPELTRLRLEQGRAMAEGEIERAKRIHARRVRLYERLKQESV